ncbi:ABC transporter permease [Bradyrhizobium lablabi]|uniref:ABC transporter permease n=1 Tax=Bradyrhizobium lablabi TaxID=722472 RepID=UPI001BAD587B|nr:ABC transporter permease [Bradyrhizobium lablabi]MBR1123163.1 ABC transporter permease [Bradyrhizobium lablabi]
MTDAVVAAPAQPSPRARLPWRRIGIIAAQLALLGIILAIWQICTGIAWFRTNTFLDPFFISRPSLVIQKLYDWTVGAQRGFLWPHLVSTVGATLLGLVVAVITGFFAGLGLSQNRALAAVFNPFIVALNSLPRIAMVPLITMIFGLGLVSKVVTAWFIVFFLIFFNAFKGGVNIEQHLINFCRTLGGSNRQIMFTVRIPNSLAWTFAALPNAVSFSLIGVVISEFVGSTTGMGYLIVTSLGTMNATDMFATITVLGVIGLVLVSVIGVVERRLLHWSPEFRRT